MNKLNIFVSSTCYDLSQIRQNLKNTIESWGHNPLLSEFKEFPINPSMKAIDNCIKTVKEDADIFVLIVGNRYGAQIENGKSITNTEFLTAQEKGIPIYVFIDKNTLNILPVWEKNKVGDYAGIVDTTKIFEFIYDIRTDSKYWTFEFEKAQDIEETLKIQLSYLFKSSLKLTDKINKNVDEIFLKSISPNALNIIMNKDRYYEMEFFLQSMVDELEKRMKLRHDYNYLITTDTKYTTFDNSQIPDWARQRLGEIVNLVHSFENLINDAFPNFYGEPGTPSDLHGLYYVSETYAILYEKLIMWTLNTRSTCVNDEFEKLKNMLSSFSKEIIAKVWAFPYEHLKTIKEIKKVPDKEGEVVFTLEVSIDDKDLQEYQEEFDRCVDYMVG